MDWRWGSDAGAWNPLKVCPLTGLAVDAGCWLRPYLDVLAEIPACGLSIWSGLPHMMAGFQGQVSCARETKNS